MTRPPPYSPRLRSRRKSMPFVGPADIHGRSSYAATWPASIRAPAGWNGGGRAPRHPRAAGQPSEPAVYIGSAPCRRCCQLCSAHLIRARRDRRGCRDLDTAIAACQHPCFSATRSTAVVAAAAASLCANSDQMPNLYVGPLDHTMAGQAGLDGGANARFERSRVREALAAAIPPSRSPATRSIARPCGGTDRGASRVQHPASTIGGSAPSDRRDMFEAMVNAGLRRGTLPPRVSQPGGSVRS